MSAHEGSQFQEAMERYSEKVSREGASGCGHPGCTVVDHRPVVEPKCSLSQPLSLAVPPGTHRHLPCPIHGEHVIRG